MSFSRLALLTTLLLGCALLAQQPNEPKTPAAPTKEVLLRWVLQLGDNDFNVREEATQKLWQAGAAAEAVLAEAARSPDAEVSRRARELLDKFKWGLYPDTPKDVAVLIGRYQGNPVEEKAAVVGELLDAGPPGSRALLKIIAAEDNQEVKTAVRNQLASELPRALPALLAENNRAILESLLLAGLQADNKLGLRNAVACWLFRGQLDQKIGHYKALEPKELEGKNSSEVLIYLYRARGDLAEAREAAGRAGRTDLAWPLVYEAADWKEAVLPEPYGGSRIVETLAYRLARARLAGTRKESEEALAELRKRADEEAASRSVLPTIAKALFLNQRPGEALEILSKVDGQEAARFEILAAQLKYSEALALVEKARMAQSKELPALEFLQARTLYRLGDKKKAQAIFTRYAGQIKPGTDHPWFDLLVEAEWQAGLADQAFDHAAEILTVSPEGNWSGRLFGKLYRFRVPAASSLWTALKAVFPQDDARANLKRLRQLLNWKVPPKDLSRWVEKAGTAIKDLKPADAERWLIALAEAAVAGGEEELARQCLEKLTSAGTLLRLGDLLAYQKKWEQAAHSYYRAWEKGRQQALPLYLSGKALVRAGREKEGQQRMELAHLLPLGNEVARYRFCGDLAGRGDTKGLSREADLQSRLSEPGTFYSADALRRMALAALARKEAGKSADSTERFFLGMMHAGGYLIPRSASVGVPVLAGTQRVLGLLADGKIEEALPLIDHCQEVLPGSKILATQVVPALEKKGKKKEADELFRKTLQVYENVCKDHPKCIWAHDTIAWISACCRRNLDTALEHAQSAVELAPDSPECLNTLAEVYFQRGDQARAIATQKKALALEPYRPYYRKQLKRLEAGDPKVVAPPNVEGGDPTGPLPPPEEDN